MSCTRKLVPAATSALAAVATIATVAVGSADAKGLPHRPDFKVPFACNAHATLKTYVGHDPDDKKVDMYRDDMPTDAPILASADGYVHEAVDPGGLEIDHGHGWFTLYLHMKSHIKPGQKVKAGQQIGVMGAVGVESHTVHLHYEQLYNPGSKDGDNDDIVRPVIQGKGPIRMDPNKPIHMTSRNCPKGTKPAPPTPPAPNPTPTPTPQPKPPPSPSAKRYWVTTFDNAPGRATPGGAQTGTLNKGRNYVYCKVAGPNVSAGSDHNRYWLKTDLDVGPANQWVSAYYLQKWGNDEAKDDSGAVIPNC